MKLSDTEWQIMRVVWQDAPVTARDVYDRLEETTGWAYTTVKTMLSRLADKGALDTRRRGNTIIFNPLITRGQARREAVRSLLDRAFDGTFGSLVQHMVTDEKLSRKDRARLAQLLAELDKSAGEKPKGRR